MMLLLTTSQTIETSSYDLPHLLYNLMYVTDSIKIIGPIFFTKHGAYTIPAHVLGPLSNTKKNTKAHQVTYVIDATVIPK